MAQRQRTEDSEEELALPGLPAVIGEQTNITWDRAPNSDSQGSTNSQRTSPILRKTRNSSSKSVGGHVRRGLRKFRASNSMAIEDCREEDIDESQLSSNVLGLPSPFTADRHISAAASSSPVQSNLPQETVSQGPGGSVGSNSMLATTASNSPGFRDPYAICRAPLVLAASRLPSGSGSSAIQS